MRNDPFPTFRRAGRWLVQIATSPRLWRTIATAMLGLAVLASVGVLSAVVSRNACSAQARKFIEDRLVTTGLSPTWWSEPTLHEVRLPGERPPVRDLRDKLFESRIVYRLDRSDVGETAEDGPPEAWAYARSEAILPFLVRTHYGWGHSRPVRHLYGRSDDVVRRAGRVSDGVITYLCAFGVVMEVDHSISQNAHFN